jgi:hypothetical protein
MKGKGSQGRKGRKAVKGKGRKAVKGKGSLLESLSLSLSLSLRERGRLSGGAIGPMVHGAFETWFYL